MGPPLLYALGAAGLVAAVAGEVAGSDVVAGGGYLAAVIGLLAGFFADRRRGPN